MKLLSFVMAVTLIAAVKLCAGDTPSANPYFSTLKTVSPAELPAKSAALVTQADTKSRVESTINVVKAAVGLNPAAAAAIVGTIAQSVPEMASVAAGAAVALVPDQAVAIARAAAAAAPSEAGKIVEAVCHLVPNEFRAVAETVAAVAPGAGKAILAGVSAAIPELKEPINKVLLSFSSGNPSVTDVLGQVTTIAKVNSSPDPVASAGAPSFHFGPPYTPPPTTPVTITPPVTGGQVPPGGRTYASP